MDPKKYFQQFKSIIKKLETSWQQGETCLSQMIEKQTDIVNPALLETYLRLIKKKHQKPGSFRTLNVNLLLEQAEQNLFQSKKIFKAQAVWHDRYKTWFLRVSYYIHFLITKKTTRLNEPFIIGVLVTLQSGTLFMRLDQILAAHFWGISYFSSNPILTKWLKYKLLQQTLDKLLIDIQSLQDIECHFYKKYSRDNETPVIPPLGKGYQFEHLIYEILNENEYTTDRATIFEDFLEKTDFRFKAPHLGRKNGARLQVTSMTDFINHHRKVLKIKRAEELIILSPRTLAEAVYKHEKGFYNDFDMEAFINVIEPFESVKQLSYQLRDIFFDAFDNHQFNDPRGPLAAIPLPVRNLVRCFVLTEAYWSTAKLRLRKPKI